MRSVHLKRSEHDGPHREGEIVAEKSTGQVEIAGDGKSTGETKSTEEV